MRNCKLPSQGCLPYGWREVFLIKSSFPCWRRA